jgi:hypothetical protein
MAMATAKGNEAVLQATKLKQNLRQGCRVELTGLSRENLNGLRGSINGSYIVDRERWPVTVDGTGGELSCKPTNLQGLASCTHCGTEKAVGSLKKCTRCRAVHYCNGGCQRAHWKQGGHKQVCREQFACTICLDDEDYPLPIQCGCGCRDAAGCAHVACKTEYAAHQGPGYHKGWHTCPTCKQKYTGAIELGLAETLWARLQARPAEDKHRQSAQNLLANAYFEAGRDAEAEALYLDLLATARRVHGAIHSNTLQVSGNLGRLLLQQGKHSAAEAVFRDTLPVQRIALGPEHEDTLDSASSLASALENQGKFSEAEPLLRDTLAIQQRVLGERHPSTLATATDLAILLGKTGQYAEAEELSRIALAQSHRMLGPEHPQNLNMAQVLAAILGAQGQTTETVALLTATLATQHMPCD